MQGYDSYVMDTDIQFGGTDQTFNMQAGRTLQKILRNKESFIITNTFLDGTDGRKMSKSWGNAIWLDDEPSDMYAKVMAIKDELIIQYYTLGTITSVSEIAEIEDSLNSKDVNPMETKKKLAKTIVTELYTDEEANAAAQSFENTIQNKEIPANMHDFSLTNPSLTTVEVLVESGLATSKSEAKRLIEQGGVEIDNVKIMEANILFKTLAKKDEVIIQVGKRKFVKVKINN